MACRCSIECRLTRSVTLSPICLCTIYRVRGQQTKGKPSTLLLLVRSRLFGGYGHMLVTATIPLSSLSGPTK